MSWEMLICVIKAQVNESIEVVYWNVYIKFN